MQEQRELNHYKAHPYRPFSDVMSDNTWQDERCFIIGGGPSLEGFDFERLHGQGRIIAVNRAFEYAPFADIVFFMDGSLTSFYGLVKSGKLEPDTLKKWEDFKGHKVYLNLVGRQLEDVYSVRSLGKTGLSNSLKHGLYHGNNSGVGAVGIAVCLGANPIYLLGFDFKFSNGKSHFHSGYPKRMPENTFRSFVRDFERLSLFLSRAHFKVINLNPDSGLKCFPFSTVDEVLGNGR